MAGAERESLEKLFDMSDSEPGSDNMREVLKFEVLLDIRQLVSKLYEEAQRP